MSVLDRLLAKETKLALVGLGYVGMPIAVEFSKKVDVIGFDTMREDPPVTARVRPDQRGRVRCDKVVRR